MHIGRHIWYIPHEPQTHLETRPWVKITTGTVLIQSLS